MSFLLVSGHCYDDLMSTWHQQNCTSKPDICRPSLKKNPKRNIMVKEKILAI